jgi:small-conductance mechanosensitive channel
MLVNRWITQLTDKDIVESHLAHIFRTVARGVGILLVITIVIVQFGWTYGAIVGLLTTGGVTIFGFAAINTIGNAIAGLIVMSSQPFRVGDRILWKEQFADIASIQLIYTKMVTLDNVVVSVPNQNLLGLEIHNFGRLKVIRRHCAVSTSFQHDSDKVEAILLKAAKRVDGVLSIPAPYVWITNFRDYAVEYSVYIFIMHVRRLQYIDADLKKSVLQACKENNIDISTPLLLKTVHDDVEFKKESQERP